MKKAALVLVLIFCSMSLLAQSNLMTSSSKSGEIALAPNRIGVSGSMISGYVLSYQRNFDPWAVKFTGFYYYFKDGTGTKNSNLPNPLYNYDHQGSYGSFGVEIKYYAFKSKYVNLYPLMGGSYWINDDNSPTYIYPSSQYLVQSKNRTFNLGAGVGLELIAGKYIAFNFDVGFVYSNTQQTKDEYQQNNVYKPVDTEGISFGPAVGGGINFVW